MSLRSMAYLAVSVSVVFLMLSAPFGALTSVVGGETPDAATVLGNTGVCLPQPGHECSQTYRVCRGVSDLSRICLPQEGPEGCANYNPTACQSHKSDTTRPPEEQ
jgi:hypothetical protein